MQLLLLFQMFLSTFFFLIEFKVNLGTARPLLQYHTGNKKSSKLTSICWSPNGMVMFHFVLFLIMI